MTEYEWDDESRAWCAELLNRLEFVTWDRLACVPPRELVGVFGWIEREDGRFDFVRVELWPFTKEVAFSTSSAARTQEISLRLYGNVGNHLPCERVEDVFGALVERKVVLAAPEAV